MSLRAVAILFLALAAAVRVAAAELLPGRTAVVCAADAPGTTAFAATELTNFLARVLGAPVPLVREPTGGRSSIVLGANAWSAAAGVSTNGLPRDAFRIRSRNGDVFIAGVDADVDLARLVARGARATPPCGTLYGVYEFLERFAGVRFYLPGELGTVVPRRGRIEAPAQDLEIAPRDGGSMDIGFRFATPRHPPLSGREEKWYTREPLADAGVPCGDSGFFKGKRFST